MSGKESTSLPCALWPRSICSFASISPKIVGIVTGAFNCLPSAWPDLHGRHRKVYNTNKATPPAPASLHCLYLILRLANVTRMPIVCLSKCMKFIEIMTRRPRRRCSRHSTRHKVLARQLFMAPMGAVTDIGCVCLCVCVLKHFIFFKLH